MGFAILSDKYYTRWCSASNDGVDDQNLILVHELLQKARFERIVFYDRETPLTRMEFMQWARCEKKMFFIVFNSNGSPAAIAWMTGPSHTGCQSFGHFSTLGTITVDEAVEAGKQWIRFIGKLTKVKQLVGITPCCYRHAIKFSQKLGFKPLTKLKQSVYCLGKERDALLSICDTEG